MLSCPQKSRHLLGFRIPPIGEPERLRRLMIRPNAETGRGLFGAPTRVMFAIAAQQIDVCAYVVIGGDSVENEIEAASVLCTPSALREMNDLVCSEAKCVFLLVR